MSYFPMFIELKNEDCLVVGGGKIALRKVKMLLDFGAAVTVVAPEILPEIQEAEDVRCIQREFSPADVKGRRLVVAATDSEEQNHKVSRLCKKQRIPVNAVDQIRDCSFIFPSYLREGEVVSAFSSGGQSPVITQYLKEQIRPHMTEHLGETAACLGAIRDVVKHNVAAESKRKQVYQELLGLALEEGTIPSEEEISAIIEKYK